MQSRALISRLEAVKAYVSLLAVNSPVCKARRAVDCKSEMCGLRDRERVVRWKVESCN